LHKWDWKVCLRSEGIQLREKIPSEQELPLFRNKALLDVAAKDHAIPFNARVANRN
jgi:hypothetical protein